MDSVSLVFLCNPLWYVTFVSQDRVSGLVYVKIGPKKVAFLTQLVSPGVERNLQGFFTMQNQRLVWKINIGLGELSFLVKVRKISIKCRI